MKCNLGESKLYLLDNKVHVNATGIFDCRGSQRTVGFMDLFAGDSSPGEVYNGPRKYEAGWKATERKAIRNG